MSDITLDLSRLTEPQRAVLEQEAKKHDCSLEEAASRLIEDQIERRCHIPALRRTILPFRRRRK